MLVSRRQLPERSIGQSSQQKTMRMKQYRQIQSIESLGATVRVVSGDVADFETMSALFAEFGNSIPLSEASSMPPAFSTFIRWRRWTRMF